MLELFIGVLLYIIFGLLGCYLDCKNAGDPLLYWVLGVLSGVTFTAGFFLGGGY